MTTDGPRPPILLIRSEGHFGSHVELLLLDADGATQQVARREGPSDGRDLESLVQEIVLAGTSFQDVIVDLEQVLWLNSTGLGWLVGLVRQRKQQGDAVALAGANERIVRILHVTSLDLVMPMHGTVAEAAAALGDGDGK